MDKNLPCPVLQPTPPGDSAPDVIVGGTSSFTALQTKKFPWSVLLQHLRKRSSEDPYFKWVIIGGFLYTAARLTHIDSYLLLPFKRITDFLYERVHIPLSVQQWMGEVESDVPFGRLGYTRCLEADVEVLEKFGIPMNTEKCLRDGISYLPGEFYPKFDLNEFDPKTTPLAWSYGPITDPGLIMPIGWFNDMSGENQEFEIFCRYLRIFGYLPSEAYEELYRHCKVVLLRCNQHLINIGDPDDKVYLIIYGAVDVYCNRLGVHGDFTRLRTAVQGGQIVSLFSIIDVLTGYAGRIQSIYAVSKLNTTKVLIFPVAALKDYLVRNHEYLVACVVRILERGYRFQYQILHLAMQLTSAASILDKQPLHEVPKVSLPPPGKDLPDKVQKDALLSFMEFLEINDYEFLKANCRVRLFEPEEETSDYDKIRMSILNQAETAYKYVYVGKLEGYYLQSNLSQMEQESRRKTVENVLLCKPVIRTVHGQGVGSLTGILGYLLNVLFFRCLERSILVTINRDALDLLLRRKPLCILPISHMTVSRMSMFIRSMDFGIEWRLAKEGQYIYHKDQMCEDSYVILNGRARSYQLDSETQKRAILEYKENDWIGLIESLLQTKRRNKTCVVIRETEFVKIPNDLLRTIVINYSSAAQTMLNFLVKRSLKSRKFEIPVVSDDTDAEEGHRESRRVRSVALVPAAETLPYSVLAVEIKKHFEQWGTCSIVTYEKTLKALKLDELTMKDQFMLEMYILEQLERADLVIFICLPRVHYWNEISSSHSEVVFTVGCSELPNIPTEPAEHEEEVVGKKISTRRKELILLHTMNVVLPQNTKEWLYCRDWLHFHHHIRLPIEAFNFIGAIPEEEIEINYHCLERKIRLGSDLSRFVRWLLGKTFGALFSSGGARIGAQLGMLQALVEHKMIPIDMVVGTGAGFLIAALYAIYLDYNKVQEIISKIFKDFRELTKLRWDDITLPYISLGNGKRLLTYIYEIFGSIQLEDAWIPICCVTTNLTMQDVRVDRSGPMWVFARASLSHINNSPPICDPIDGDYICDGAHSNSLPQDIIKEYGANYIIAFNTVGGKLEDSEIKADPNVNVLRFFKKTAYAFVRQLGLANPSFEDVYNQLALTQTRMYAAGIEAVSNLKLVIYVRPPVEHLPSQSWKNLPTLHRIGYFYMKAILDKNPYTEGVSLNTYWTAIKTTSSDMASEGGRDLTFFNTYIN